MLIKSRQWIDTNFAKQSRPTIATVTRWIRTNEIDGQIIGGLAFVEHDALDKKYIANLPRPTPKLIAGKYELK